MEFILLLLTLVVGGIAGLIVAHYSNEELKTGKRFFMFIQPLLMLVIMVVVAAYSDIAFAVVLVLVFLSALLINKEIYNFMLLGVVLALVNEGLLAIVASIVLLYFLINSALLYQHSMELKEKKIPFFTKTLLVKYILFLILALIGYFI
ncbi:MAG: hypothetical protein KKG59_07640 [Nanoarchaeota archaeon]|nr:hypothetical protein [Nanoarchaeota archaeon]